MTDLKLDLSAIDEEDISNVIATIMSNDGPDGHIDGHEIIAEFIMALLDGKGNKWAQEYKQKSGSKGMYY